MQRSTHISPSQLKFVEELKNNDSFSRIISIMKKNCSLSNTKSLKHTYKWYLKIDDNKDTNRETVDSLMDSLIEVIGLELLRLFMPRQPKARLCIQSKTTDEYNQCAGVLIKKIKGFNLIGKPKDENLPNVLGNHSLIEIITFAKILQENDLRWENLAWDKNNEAVYFDGNYLLTNLLEKGHSFKLTAGEFRAIPYVHDTNLFKPANWLHQITYSLKKNEISINFSYTDRLKEKFYDTPQIIEARKAINSALLMFLILPDKIINEFLDTYFYLDNKIFSEFKNIASDDNSDDELQEIDFGNIEEKILKLKTDTHQLLLARKTELKEAIQDYSDFSTYLNSDAASEKIDKIIVQFKDFKMAHREKLGSLIPSIEEDIKNEFINLKNYCNNKGKDKNVVNTTQFFSNLQSNIYTTTSDNNNNQTSTQNGQGFGS